MASSLKLSRSGNGRTFWIADAHRGDGKRFIVRADEKLAAPQELETGTVAFPETIEEVREGISLT